VQVQNGRRFEKDAARVVTVPPLSIAIRRDWGEAQDPIRVLFHQIRTLRHRNSIHHIGIEVSKDIPHLNAGDLRRPRPVWP